jgi:hypothetical protein
MPYIRDDAESWLKASRAGPCSASSLNIASRLGISRIEACGRSVEILSMLLSPRLDFEVT